MEGPPALDRHGPSRRESRRQRLADLSTPAQPVSRRGSARLDYGLSAAHPSRALCTDVPASWDRPRAHIAMSSVRRSSRRAAPSGVSLQGSVLSGLSLALAPALCALTCTLTAELSAEVVSADVLWRAIMSLRTCAVPCPVPGFLPGTSGTSRSPSSIPARPRAILLNLASAVGLPEPLRTPTTLATRMCLKALRLAHVNTQVFSPHFGITPEEVHKVKPTKKPVHSAEIGLSLLAPAQHASYFGRG